MAHRKSIDLTDLASLKSSLYLSLKCDKSEEGMDLEVSSKGKSGKQPLDESEKRFCAAISLSDGVVKHTTKSFSQAVGYPKDMWIGRNIVDFIHPEDQQRFSSHVAENLHMEIVDGTKQSFCIRLKQYKGLKHTGFAVKSQRKSYNPFKLSTFFQGQDISPLETTLFLIAEPIHCAYSLPLEVGPVTNSSGQTCFCTQLQPDFTISWVDDKAISFTGFLTQQLLGHGIFKFIHPSDQETVNKMFQRLLAGKCQGGDSTITRMVIRNKTNITLTSRWTSFVNPWSQKLEFIMGSHSVLLGPETVDNFFEDVRLQDMSTTDYSDTRKFLPRMAAVAATNRRVVAALPRDIPSYIPSPLPFISPSSTTETETEKNMNMDDILASSSKAPLKKQRSRVTNVVRDKIGRSKVAGLLRSNTFPPSEHEQNMKRMLSYFEGSKLFGGLKVLHPNGNEAATAQRAEASDSSDVYTFLHTTSDMITLPSSIGDSPCKDETTTKPNDSLEVADRE